MLNVDRMDIAGHALESVVKGLTDEEVGRMLIAYVPGACRWVVDYYNENSKNKEEKNKLGKVVETSKEISFIVRAMELLEDDWLKKAPRGDDGVKKIREIRDKVVAMLSKEGGE